MLQPFCFVVWRQATDEKSKRMGKKKVRKKKRKPAKFNEKKKTHQIYTITSQVFIFLDD